MALAGFLAAPIKVGRHIPSVGPAFAAIDVRRDIESGIADFAAQIWCGGFEYLGQAVEVNAQAVFLDQDHLGEQAHGAVSCGDSSQVRPSILVFSLMPEPPAQTA